MGTYDYFQQMRFEQAEKLFVEKKFEEAFNLYFDIYNFCDSISKQIPQKNISSMLIQPERLLFRIAVIYYNGIGTDKNIIEAVKFYNMAADLGDVDSIYDLGRMYAMGEDVSKDLHKAIQLFQRAIAKGDIESIFMIASVYSELGKSKEAIKYYIEAADKGNANAQFDLFVSYYNGDGVSTDHNKALYWLRKAANQNFPQAVQVMNENRLW